MLSTIIWRSERYHDIGCHDCGGGRGGMSKGSSLVSAKKIVISIARHLIYKYELNARFFHCIKDPSIVTGVDVPNDN